MTTDDHGLAALEAALDHSCVAHRFDSWEHWKADHAATILAALDGWHLERDVTTADWTGSTRKDADAALASESGHCETVWCGEPAGHTSPCASLPTALAPEAQR